jgi:GNAT superfamily N-acetyltransferase
MVNRSRYGREFRTAVTTQVAALRDEGRRRTVSAVADQTDRYQRDHLDPHTSPARPLNRVNVARRLFSLATHTGDQTSRTLTAVSRPIAGTPGDRETAHHESAIEWNPMNTTAFAAKAPHAATPTFQRARTADIPQLSFTAAAAYQDTALSAWLVEDPRARRDVLPGYFRLLLQDAIAVGTVYTTSTRDLVAVWLPISRGQPPKLVDDDRLADTVGDWAPRFRTLHELLATRHPTAEFHEWLTVLAVDPLCQRHGAAAALLHRYHSLLDRDHTPAHVVVDQHHREFFLRRGYVDTGEPLRIPAGGPTLFTLRRDPRPVTHTDPWTEPMTAAAGPRAAA